MDATHVSHSVKTVFTPRLSFSQSSRAFLPIPQNEFYANSPPAAARCSEIKSNQIVAIFCAENVSENCFHTKDQVRTRNFMNSLFGELPPQTCSSFSQLYKCMCVRVCTMCVDKNDCWGLYVSKIGGVNKIYISKSALSTSENTHACTHKRTHTYSHRHTHTHTHSLFVCRPVCVSVCLCVCLCVCLSVNSF